MSDIVTRLRNWRTVHLARLHLLMDEAADEMERLRQVLSQKHHCPDADNAAEQDILTGEEREAVSYYLGTGGPDGVDATLRGLLERTGGER
jgi:hypothetical protein